MKCFAGSPNMCQFKSQSVGLFKSFVESFCAPTPWTNFLCDFTYSDCPLSCCWISCWWWNLHNWLYRTQSYTIVHSRTQSYTVVHNHTQSYTIVHNRTQSNTIEHNQIKSNTIKQNRTQSNKIEHTAAMTSVHTLQIILSLPVSFESGRRRSFVFAPQTFALSESTHWISHLLTAPFQLIPAVFLLHRILFPVYHVIVHILHKIWIVLHLQSHYLCFRQCALKWMHWKLCKCCNLCLCAAENCWKSAVKCVGDLDLDIAMKLSMSRIPYEGAPLFVRQHHSSLQLPATHQTSHAFHF